MDVARSPKTLLVHVHNRKRIQFNLSGIYPMLPLGLAVLGAQLEAAGLPVELLDLSLRENSKLSVADEVRRKGYDVVGLSATVFSLPETVLLSKEIKRAAPDVFLIVGGPATIFSAETMFGYLPDVDVFVFGEGEDALVKLIRAKSDKDSLADIPGIAFRQNEEVILTPPAEPIKMDDLPLPARHLLPCDRYGMHPPFGRFPPITLIETARGCPYQCAFCSLPMTWRARSPEHVMTEIRQEQARYKIQEVHFVDPTFTADMERAQDLAREMAPLGLHFSFKTRLDLVNPDLLADMKAAGCYLISYGVESIQPNDLRYLNKSIKDGLPLARIRETKRAGIDVIAYMLVGSPDDSLRSSWRSTHQLVKAGCDFALFSDLFPDPDTPLTLQAIQKGWVTLDQINEFYFRQVPLPGARSLSGHPARQVKRWVLLSFVAFYFSPRTLYRMFFKSRSYRDLFKFISVAFHLVADMLFPNRTV